MRQNIIDRLQLHKLSGYMALLVVLSVVVLAANDPGHDPLYVEQEGNSTLNGTLNITMDLRVAQRIYSDYLDVRGDGTFSGSTSRMVGTSTDLYIESSGDIIFNEQIGTTSMVRMGFTGDAVDLNVTGNVYVQGTDIQLDGVSVCLENGTNCAAVAGASSGGGWTNTSTLISSNTGDNITMDSGVLYVDATNNRVGVNNTHPNSTLHVVGNASISGNLYENGNRVCTASNGLCADGTGTDDQTLQEVTTQGATTTDAITIDSDGNENTIIGGDLNVSGTINSTGNMYEAGSRVCTAANGLCDSGGGSSGGWTNNSINTTTTLKVGIGTENPMGNLDIYGNVNDNHSRIYMIRTDTVTGTDETMGEILFDSTDGGVSTVDAPAIIRGVAQGHDVSTKGGELAFLTRPSGSQGDTSAIEHLRITHNGYIGIGDPDPQTKVVINVTHSNTVAGNNEYSMFPLLIRNNYNASGVFTGIAFDVSEQYTAADAIGAAIYAERDSSAGTTSTLHDTNIHIATNDLNNDDLTVRFTVTHDGLVGLSETDPSYHMHLMGLANGDNPQIFIERNDGGIVANEILGEIMFDGSDGVSTEDASVVLRATADGTHSTSGKSGALYILTKQLLTQDGQNATMALHIDSNQYTGITSYAPQTRFEINHSASTSVAASNLITEYPMVLRHDTNTTGRWTGIAFDISEERDSDSIGASIYAERDSSAGTDGTLHDTNLRFATNDDGDDDNTVRMTITHNGYVGINNTDPGSTLTITGNISSSGAMYAAGSQVCTASNGLCAGSGGNSGGWTNTSTYTTTTLDVNITGDLNVSGTINSTGNIYEAGSRVCTAANGLCPDTDDQTLQEVTTQGATTTDAITIDSDGNEITIIGGTLNVSGTLNVTTDGYIAGSQICTPANGLCNNSGGSSSNEGGGWTNTTTLISSNTGVNITMDSAVLFVDATDNQVGIGTNLPNETFTVVGEQTILGNTTYDLRGSNSKVCFEKFEGTSYNYSRCVNSTGHVTERVGIFNLNE